MASLNQVVLIGNVTRDPELRYTPSGTAVCDVSIAVNEKYTTKQGEKREEVNYIDCVCWAKTAEIAAEYLKKGRSVCVVGKLKQDRWEDQKSGQKRSKIHVVVNNIQFLGGKNDAKQSGPPQDEEKDPLAEAAETGGAPPDSDSAF